MTDSLQIPPSEPHITGADTTLQPPPSSALGRMIRATGKEAAEFIAIPSTLASLLLKTINTPLNVPILRHITHYSAGGVLFVTASTVHAVASGTNSAIDIAQKWQLIHNASQTISDISKLRLENAQKQRELEGAAVQATASAVHLGATVGAKVAGYGLMAIPGLGSLAAPVLGAMDVVQTVASAASVVEQQERAFSYKVLTGAQPLTAGLAKISSVGTNALLYLVKYTAAMPAEMLSGYLKTKSIAAIKNPLALANTLSEMQRGCDWLSFKIGTYFEEKIASEIRENDLEGPLEPKVDVSFVLKVVSKKVSPDELRAFCQKSAPYRNELFKLLSHYADQIPLNEEQLKNYESTLKEVSNCKNSSAKISALLKNERTQSHLRELISLFTYLEGGVNTIFIPFEHILFPINPEQVAQAVTEKELSYFRALSADDQNEIVAAILQSPKIHLTDSQKSALNRKEDEASVKQIVGLFKTLSFDQKSRFLPERFFVVATIDIEAASQTITDEDLTQFIQRKTPQEKSDILYVVCDSKMCSIEYARYNTVLEKLKSEPEATLSLDEKQALKELIGIYSYLPTQERHKLTPGVFNSYDALTKLQVLHIVQQFAEDLQPHERNILFPINPLTHAQDLLALSEKQQKDLSELLLLKWNKLPEDIKGQLYNISYQQYLELPNKNAFLQRITGDEIDAATLSKAEIERYLSTFNKTFNQQQKIEVYNSLQAEMLVFSTSLPELEQLITQCELHLSVEQDENKKRDLQRLVTHLKAQLNSIVSSQEALSVESAHAITSSALEPIDMQKILSLVGKDTVNSFGIGVRDLLGKPSAAFFNTLAWASNPTFIEYLMNGTATAIECALIFEGVQKIVMRQVAAIPGGLQLETAMQNMPLLILKQFQNAFSSIQHGMESGARTLLAAKAHLDLLEKAIPGYYNLSKTERQELVQKYTHELVQKQETVRALLNQRAKEFANAVAEICSVSKPLMCQDTVKRYLTDPSTWPHLAHIYDIKPDSMGFLKLLEQMAKQGQMPGPQSFLSTLSEADRETMTSFTEFTASLATQAAPIGAETKSTVSAFLGWLSKQSIVKKGTHYAKAAGELLAASGISEKVTSGLEAASDTAKATLETGATLWRQFRGVEQALDPRVKELFTKMSIKAGEIAALETEKNTFACASLGIESLQNIWYGSWLLLPLASYGMNAGEPPTMAINAFNGLREAMKIGAHLSGGFLELVSAQVEPKTESDVQKLLNESVEHDLQNLFLTSATKAISTIQDPKAMNEMLQIGGNIPGAVAGAFNLYKLFGAQLFMTVELARRIVPPLLRAYATSSTQVRPFWQGLAQKMVAKQGAKGPLLFEAAGSFAQFIYNKVTYSIGYVDPIRVQNFLHTLQDHERAHLIELARASSHASAEEKSALSTTSGENQAKIALAILDRFTLQEQLQLSPTSFGLLSPQKQAKLIRIVEREIGLTAKSRKNLELVVKHFNTLPDSIRNELSILSVEEFSSMSLNQQETIFFILADAEVSAQYTSSLLVSTSTNEAEAVLRKLEAFQRISKMSNNDLKPLLESYHTLSNEAQQILTPDQLYSMSDAKLRHVLSIVSGYPQLLDTLKQTGAGNDISYLYRYIEQTGLTPLQERHKERLLQLLATVYNSLDQYKRDELLQLTLDECKAFSKDDKEKVLYFLLSQKELEKNHERLHELLACSAENKPIDEAFITKCFNSVNPHEIASFRQQFELGKQMRLRFRESVQQEFEKTVLRLEVFRSKRDRYDQEMLALTLKITNAENELKEAKSQGKDTRTFEANLAQYSKRKQLLVQKIVAIESKQSQEIRNLSRLQRLLTNGENIFNATSEEFVATISDRDRVAFEASHKLVVTECQKINVDSHINNLREFDRNDGLAAFQHQIRTSREHLTGMVKLADMKIDACKQTSERLQAEIQKRRQSIRDNQSIKSDQEIYQLREEMIHMQLQVKALILFYLPMYKGIKERTQSTLDEFEQQVPKIQEEKFPTHLQI